MTDPIGSWLRAIAGGGKGAFAALYQDQNAIMSRYAAGLLAGDCDAAADVVDEAFMEIWRTADAYAGEGSAQGWIRRIVRNKAIDHLRRRSRTPLATDAQAETFARQADDAPGPEAVLQEKSASLELRRALERLTPDHREVVWLCYFEDMALSDIARQVGCPENTVKTRLFHARKALRGLLEDRA